MSYQKPLDQNSSIKEYAINSDLKVRADAKILDYANFSTESFKKVQDNNDVKLEALRLIKSAKKKIIDLKKMNLY